MPNKNSDCGALFSYAWQVITNSQSGSTELVTTSEELVIASVYIFVKHNR